MIDREKVIEGLEKVWDAFNHMEHELYADYVFDALALLKEQEVVVRCKDCKYRSFYCTEATDGTTLYMCHHPCANDVPRPPDWFCADGKRKE